MDSAWALRIGYNVVSVEGERPVMKLLQQRLLKDHFPGRLTTVQKFIVGGDRNASLWRPAQGVVAFRPDEFMTLPGGGGSLSSSTSDVD